MNSASHTYNDHVPLFTGGGTGRGAGDSGLSSSAWSAYSGLGGGGGDEGEIEGFDDKLTGGGGTGRVIRAGAISSSPWCWSGVSSGKRISDVLYDGVESTASVNTASLFRALVPG
jgi:hypothetical protein